MTTPTPGGPLYHVGSLQITRDHFGHDEILWLSGWCFEPGSRTPVRLELRAGEETVLSFSCDRPRRDVGEAYAHLGDDTSLPLCGFSHHLYLAAEMESFELVSPVHGLVLARADRHSLTFAEPPERPLPPAKPSFRPSRTYQSYQANNDLPEHLRRLLSDAAGNLAYRPVFSLLMPVHDAQPDQLLEAVGSVRSQLYRDWQLLIVDDFSQRTPTIKALESLARQTGVEVLRRPHRGGFAAACAEATERATGDYVAVLEPTDRLAPHALFEMARALQASPELDVIYSDEDALVGRGRRDRPRFKPDWSPALLLAYDYLGGLLLLRRSLFDELGGFDGRFEGAERYDLMLRASEATERIAHIPTVLYHRRMNVPLGTANGAGTRRVAESALRGSLDRRKIRAFPYPIDLPDAAHQAAFQLDWPDDGPRVDLIIRAGADLPALKACIDAVLAETSYENYEVFAIVENDSAWVEEGLGESLASRVHLVGTGPGSENRSANQLLDRTVHRSEADFILLLDAHLEVEEPRWLSRMVGYGQLPGVGAAGACLIDHNRRIRHAGIVLGAGAYRQPEPAFRGHPIDRPSYGLLAHSTREVSALTSSCLLTPRTTLIELGGLAGPAGAAWSAVDYCRRVRERGQRCLYVADAVLSTRSARSRNGRIRTRRPSRADRTLQDPYYNPNLAGHASFVPSSASTLDCSELLRKPLRVVCFVHNFSLEGGPKILLDSVADLHRTAHLDLRVVSFLDGPRRAKLAEERIAVDVLELPGSANVLHGWRDREHLEACIERVVTYLEQTDADVVMTAVLNTFFVVEAAHRCGKPAVWFIQESFSAEDMRRRLPWFGVRVAERAFQTAQQVVFGSHETRALYEWLNETDNFTVVYNALEPSEVDHVRRTVSKAQARAAIDAEPDKKILLSVGTVCSRKKQDTLVRAASILARKRSDFQVYIVGARKGDSYADLVTRTIETLGLEPVVKLVEETPFVHRYYRAADIMVMCSLVESYSYAVLEAMAHGLPIVSTPACGVREQVAVGLNAVLFPFGDARTLALRLDHLLSNEGQMRRMGDHSRRLFEDMQTPSESSAEYARLVLAAWQRRGGSSAHSGQGVSDSSLARSPGSG